MKTCQGMVQAEREISFNFPLSGTGVHDAESSLLALNDDRERNSRYLNFQLRANRIYRLAETMGLAPWKMLLICTIN